MQGALSGETEHTFRGSLRLLSAQDPTLQVLARVALALERGAEGIPHVKWCGATHDDAATWNAYALYEYLDEMEHDFATMTMSEQGLHDPAQSLRLIQKLLILQTKIKSQPQSFLHSSLVVLLECADKVDKRAREMLTSQTSQLTDGQRTDLEHLVSIMARR